MSRSISHHHVSRETLIRARELADKHQKSLDAYLDQLLWWNDKVNLVSRDVSRETLQEHLVHSIIPAAMELFEGIDDWVDAGSGGGLPGIPLALVEPDTRWLLNDIVQKKILAVRQIARSLKLVDVDAEAGSIEHVSMNGGRGVITKHAFSVGDLLQMIEGKPWKKVIMLKGGEEAREELNCTSFEGSAHLYTFDFGDREPFYRGKGILVLTPLD